MGSFQKNLTPDWGRNGQETLKNQPLTRARESLCKIAKSGAEETSWLMNDNSKLE
jgi:hypothetical protein